MKKRIRMERGAAVFSITQKCNNYCIMCYNPRLLRDNPSYEELKKDIKNIKPNLPDIYVTGGEPTIRKDFFKLINLIKEENLKTKINLITNGRMLSYFSFAKKILESPISEVITEIHASTPELHDKITQVKGSFEQTAKGIKNLILLDVPVQCRIVISKVNYKDLPQLAKFIITNFKKLEKVVIFPINIIGEAHKNKEKVAPQYKDIKLYVQHCVDILEKQYQIDLFHFPFCVIDKKYWRFIKGPTTNDGRLTFTQKCKTCIKKKACPRIWKTYFYNFGDAEFKGIKDL